MARKIVAKRKAGITKPIIMKNQFFGMLILAVGIGALIVMVRYFIISLYVPTDVYLIEPSDLIPGVSQDY